MRGEIAFAREKLPPLSDLEREWRALEARADASSFFTSWAWIGTLLDTLPADERPLLLRGQAGGETVALGLLGNAMTRRRHNLIRSRGLYLNETGNPQFDVMTIEHNGLLTIAPLAQTIAGLLDWFARLRGEADELHLSGMARRICETAIARAGLMSNEIATPSYSIELARLTASDGDLAVLLSANARQQLRRAFRHFAACGPLQIRAAADQAEAQDWLTGLKRLHARSWARRGKAHSFTRPFFERFHRRLIERCFAEGGVEMLETRAGERVIGYLYNLRHHRRVYAYQSGFDDGNPRERPGYVAHALAVRHAVCSGMQTYDFMAGRNRLKRSLATACELMSWQIVQQPRLRFRLENAALRLKEAVLPIPKIPLAGGSGRR